MLMKKNHLFTCSKMICLALIGATTFFLASCADHYDGDESWSSSVRNAQLESPAESAIRVVDSSDGGSLEIDWDVVFGAGGYAVKVVDCTSPDNEVVILDKVVDGCNVTANREEDANYRIEIRALGNEKYNNKEATSATVKTYTTCLESNGTIPAGDIKDFFDSYQWPETIGDTLCFDLLPDADYTISGVVDLGGHWVNLRCNDKHKKANLTFGAEGKFVTNGGLLLKYLNIDASQTKKPLVSLSSTPDESQHVYDETLSSNSYYFLKGATGYQSCNIKSLGSTLFGEEASIKYDVRVFRLVDCLVEVFKSAENPNKTDDSVIGIKNASYVTDFVVKNSTVYSLEKWGKAFITYGGRPKDINTEELQKMTFENSTFYQISYNTNFRGDTKTQGQKTNYFTVIGCIIFDTGKKNFCNSLLRQNSTNPTVKYSKNTYWWGGADVSADQTSDGGDKSGSALHTDPAFKDTENGDFTPTGSEQVENKTGDPRWFN